MDLEDGGMVIRLSPEAARTLREISESLGYEPVELVRVGLGIMNMEHESRRMDLRLALVNSSGKAIHEVVIPPPGTLRRSSTTDIVKQILEDSRPSESLWQSIVDLDPDRPDSKNR